MNKTKIYVGNLSYDVTSDQLQDFFGGFGEIAEVKLISDFETGRSKGFGFVTFADEEAAAEAVEKSNGESLDGRNLKVNLARDNNRAGGGARRPQGNRDYARENY